MGSFIRFLPFFPIISLFYRGIPVKCDFCSEDMLASESLDLRFTKELSDAEFGIGRHSKSLHCCAANYKSILWFKGDKLYPWKDGESNFILDPKSNNQTLYVEELSKQDAGTYSCYVTSDSLYRSRHIPLIVFEIDFTGIPKKTYIPPARESVDLDGTARLYCETFVGKIDLPDARSKISWFKIDVNNKRIELPNVNDTRTSVRKVIRDDGQTIGMYLIIEHVQPSDNGQYVCSVSNTDDQIIEMQSEIVIIEYMFNFSRVDVRIFVACMLLGSLLLIITLTAACLKYKYELKLLVREHVIPEKNDTNKEYDVFILYEPKEINFVDHVLVPKLVNEYDYKVNFRVLECGSAINVECQSRIAVSRSILVVLPVSDIVDVQCQKYFSQKLYLISTLHTKVTCLLIQENPDCLSPECRSWMSSINHVKFLTWPRSKSDSSKLWQSLRLHLPIKKKAHTVDNCNYSTVNNDRHAFFSTY